MSTLSKERLEFIHVPFSTISNKDRASQMGLIILETDLTIETEFRKFLSQDENEKKKILQVLIFRIKSILTHKKI